jgi:hypothetical protein
MVRSAPGPRSSLRILGSAAVRSLRICGRLTLNVLLTFAQFEREVIGVNIEVSGHGYTHKRFTLMSGGHTRGSSIHEHFHAEEEVYG